MQGQDNQTINLLELIVDKPNLISVMGTHIFK